MWLFFALIGILVIPLFFGPSITGLFGVEPVSEVLHFSSSSSTMLVLQGVPESLVFSGHWNNQGSGRLYAEFDGVRLLALDTQKLGSAGFDTATSVAFTDACVETCIVAIATTPDVTLVYESEGGATLDITAYGELGASEPVAAPTIEAPIAELIVSPTLIESEPTPTKSEATEPTPTSAVIVEPVEAPSITPSTAVFTPTGFSVESIGFTSPANGTPDSVDAQGINDGFGSTDSVTVDTINTGNDVYVGLIRANAFATSLDLEGYLNMSYNITNITSQPGVTLTNFTFFLDHCFSGDTSAPVTCGTDPVGTVTIENSAIELFNFSSGRYKKVSDWVGTISTEGTHKFNVTQGLSDFVSATNFVNVRYVVNVTMGTLSAASLGADLAVMEAKFTIDNAPSISSAILSSTSGSNSTNDNLTVALSGVADADGDVVWNITDWRRANNTGGFASIAVLNMPFDFNVSSSLPNASPDYTTFHNNGTLGGDAEAPLWNASGKVGGAFQFDGIDDFIEINNSPSLNLNAQNLTISVWIYPSGSLGRVVCKDDGGGSRDYCVSFGDSGGLNARFFATVAAGMPVIDSTLLLPLDAWSHVAVTYDGTTFRMYINGTDDTTADVTSTLVGSSVPLRIGRSVEGYTFPGLIDEVLIFNRTLSGAQVRELFNASMNNKHLMTIHSDETQINEVWQVAVTPTDNRSDGATVLSNNLTIRDTLDSCQTLGAGTYYLGTSLTTTGPSCFNFTANNALLDCNGFSITGSRLANSHGINASSRLNVTVQNCVITNFSDGIFFTRVRRGTIFNNVIVNNSDDGIDLGNNNFTLISHNTLANNSDNGIEMTGWYNNVTNNTIQNNRGAATSHGLQTFRGSATVPGSGPASFRIINNTFIDNQNDGLNVAWLNDSVIANNTFSGSGDDAMSITNGTTLIITGNNMGNGGDDGILLEGTNYSFIAHNNVSERPGQNLDVVRSNNNNFSNNTLFYGNIDVLRLRLNSNNNTFWNNTLFSNNSWFAINDTSTLNNNFTNTTFANSNGSILLSFFQANISQEVNTTVLNISSNRAYLNATNLTWMNVSATIIINHTGMSFTNPIAQVDYGDTLTYEDCPADVCTTIGSATDSFSFNVSHWTSFATTDGPVEGNSITIAACGNLSAFGKTYVLTADVTSTQTCFQVQNHNITLDCNGHTVTYGGSSNIADGVNVSHARNTTIAGCTLSESASGTSSPYYSVEIRGSNDTRIINNSMFVRTSSSAGVGYSGSFSSRNNSVINNSILSHNNGYGISVAVSTGNQIIGNRIEMNGTSTGISAITLGTTSNNATVESNRIVTRDNKGITMSTGGVANMTIINNTITSNTSTALETGAAGASGNSNIVINNTLRSVTSVALYIYSSHNLIWQNSMSTWSGNAVKIAGSANNNSLINNTLYAHNGTTIYADTTASKVRFQNTTLWSNASWFYSVHSSNTDINFTDITFAFGNGTIRFTGNGTFPIGEANITVVNMTLNASRAFVQARSLPMFNQSAEITWFNRTGDDPQLFHVLITCTAGGVCTERETTPCSADTCTKQSYSANTLKFNVSHWSAYETKEQGTYCGELFESTTLKTNLKANETCFRIRTSNIFLDCNGTTIEYANRTGNGAGAGHAVEVNSSTNVTIKNCIFLKVSGTPTDAHAVNFTNVNYSVVINNSIVTNGSDDAGIYLTQSHFNNLTGNNITTTGAATAHGIYLFTTNTHNRIENNTILTKNNDNYGIDLDTTANNNTLIRNNITVTKISTSTQRGILLTTTVHNNTLQHNSVSVTGAANMIGIYVFGTASKTLIENNTVDMNGSSTGNQGIVLETAGTSSQYARIINNTIHTNGSAGSYAVFLTSNIYNTTIANNTFIANSSGASARGVYISGSVSQTNITNNVIYVDDNSSDSYGITDAGSGRFDVIVDNLIYPNGGGTGGLAYGIDLSTNSPSHSNISRNTIIGRARINIVGLYIAGANNSVFENVVDITGNAGPTGTNNRGVWLAGSAAGGSGLYNLTMRANTIVVNNTASGIGILYAPSYSGGPANPNGTNLIENNTVTVESIVGGDTGVSIENEAWWSRFVGNFIRMNGTGNLTGFDLDSADNNTIENNTVLVLGRAEGNAGVKFTGSGLANRNNVTNNAFYVEGTGNTTGANFDAAGGVTQSWFRNNNFTVNGTLPRNFGIDMEDPTPASGGPYSFNNFTGNTFTVYGLHARGIILDTKSSGAPIVRDNQFHNTTITVEGEGSYAIYVSSDTAVQPATTAFNNTVIDNAPFWTFTGSNAILNLSKIKFLTPNGSIEYPRLLMGGSNNISRFALNITQNRVFVNSTFIGGGPPSTNSSANITLNLTGMGFVIPRPAYDFHHTGTNTTCDVTNCTNKGFSNSILTFNVSHWTIYTAEETTSSACGPLTTSTTLLQDVSATGTCFTIEDDDITLNCNGTTITYDTGGSGGNGVTVFDRDNTVIKNCFIQDATVAGAGSVAVNLTRA
ncbi:right-handed parallel beta-helix repeat-containing protein, partial [Candidatus Woesearchaeota archaeon]|nr:right-handed parallel beta-helix repeat-containing protein [Candidatus Woesearchaeota archaeon]